MLKIIIYHNSYKLPDPSIRKQIKKSKNEDSHHRSLRRSKMMIKDIIISNHFEFWCTFTYNCRSCQPFCNNSPCTCDPQTCKRYDINYCRRTLQNWFRNQKKHSPDLKYLAVPEFHKNGAIHFHCLLENFNGRLKDSGKKTRSGQIIYNASGYYSGFTDFVKIGELSGDFNNEYLRVANYISKYITKDIPMIYGRRRYLVSDNVIRPTSHVNGISYFYLDNIIKNYKPQFINNVFEIQHHQKVGRLSHDMNHQLF